MKRTLLVLALSLGFAIPHAKAADVREVIELNPDQFDHVVMEMQGYLQAIQDILLAVAENDMGAVKDIAKTMAPGGGAGLGMNEATPLEFRQLGRATHLSFVELEQFAELGANAVIAEMSVLMSNCAGCHGAYRIVLKQ